MHDVTGLHILRGFFCFPRRDHASWLCKVVSILNEFTSIVKAVTRLMPSFSADRQRTEAVVIVITGGPGAGKSTLGPQLASSLGLPFLSRDTVKEILFDHFWGTLAGIEQPCDPGQRISQASWDIWLSTVMAVAGPSRAIVVDGVFNQAARREAFLRAAEEKRLRLLEVFLDAPADVLLHRVAARSRQPYAHAIYRYHSLGPAKLVLAHGWPQLLGDQGETLRVDVSNLAMVDVAELARRIEKLLEEPCR
jgi:predicted kinase